MSSSSFTVNTTPNSYTANQLSLLLTIARLYYAVAASLATIEALIPCLSF